eukprot:gb/GFBE01047765.1/.p1 GENE.gb/GFBE01047765.1/~~gb/GFBE01047765.1/.p1  ORF type:complete len:681 (+),score=90.76 gb/GFBE01047765.1/:1-2043(+)
MGCLSVVRFLLILAGAGQGVSASSQDDGDNRTCFWAVAARFERFWTLADYERFTSSTAVGGPLLHHDESLGLRHIFFVVKASFSRAHFAVQMEKTWMHAAANRIYLVDALIPNLPMSCQVVMNDGQPLDEGDSVGSRDAIAVSRLMIWINQAKISYDVGGLPPDTRWIVVLGDDVYVNLARLYYFLAQHASSDNHPVIFSHVLSDTEVYDFDMPCLDSGGVALSRSAFDLLSLHASCKACPFIGSDAMSLAYCAFYNGVPIVHVPMMHCHPQTLGDTDRDLTADMLAHQWISAGGLSTSDLGMMAKGLEDDQLLMHHPFEDDFPSSSCKLPSGALWSYQQLVERIRFCRAAEVLNDSDGALPKLVDGSVLLPGHIQEHFDMRWPGRLRPGLLSEITFDGYENECRDGHAALLQHLHELSSQDTNLDASWYFLRSGDVWFHSAQVGRFLQELELSGLIGYAESRIAFAFVEPVDPGRSFQSLGSANSAGNIDLRPGLLVSHAAAWAMVKQQGTLFDSLTAAVLNKLNITVVHTPLLVPHSAALPRSLNGLVSEGALSGAWSLGRVEDSHVFEDLNAKADNRRFFAGLLEENFEDLATAGRGEPCGSMVDGTFQKTLQAARRWMRFLHNDDEHIKVVRGFQSGRREFRTLHAMYRSEAGDAPPLHGVHPDTILVARDCPHAE